MREALIAALPMLVACHASPATAGATPAAALGATLSCPSDWLEAPPVDAVLAPPSGAVIAHVHAEGTQGYACARGEDGGAGWAPTGPSATLRGCRGEDEGRHFASDAGPSAPEWKSPDGTFVVGRKRAASTPDGGSGSVPWLLLDVVDRGGAGEIGQGRFVQRVATDGGVAPAGVCRDGERAEVPYVAEYYFVR